MVSWPKHGCTSLLIPGHDPPLNITIFGDIAINPGPETLIQNNLKRRNENLPNILDLHINTRVITYTRAELLGIRRASRSFVCGSVLHVLKLNGLLRFRGCRAGRRKISVRISDRISHTTCRDRTTSRTSVLVPIVPEQRFRVGSYLKFCSLNARSVRNKSADLVSYVESSGADIFAVTETWLSEIDAACRAEITPPGYKLFDHTRSDRCGGGTALLIRENLHASRLDAGERTSSEFSHWMVEFQSRKLQIIIIYRPPYSSNHPVTTNVFFADFSSFLENIIMSSVPLLIAGDFNIHVDVPGNADSVCLKELLQSMGLQQHVNVPTHESGHTLDLIITRQCDSLLANIPVTDCLFSDHSSLIWDLTLDRPPLPKKKISFRKTKVVDVNLLCDELSTTSLCTDSPDALNDLVKCIILHYLRLLIVMLHLSLSLSQ